jgi:hypothetical protein
VNSAGVNTFPAVDKITLAGGKASLTPVLLGNATATDTTTNQPVTLNEIDPDSMLVDPQGNVVLDNQAGAELVFLHNAGSSQQTVTRVAIGTAVDDFGWATAASGFFFIVDGPANMIWKMTATFTPGTVYVEAPNDSGVASFVGTLDLKTGIITPIAVGFASPTGLLFMSSGGPYLAASYVHVNTVGTWTTITWRAPEVVRGYNIFDGRSRINTRPVTSRSLIFHFKTQHVFHHLRLTAVL